MDQGTRETWIAALRSGEYPMPLPGPQEGCLLGYLFQQQMSTAPAAPSDPKTPDNVLFERGDERMSWEPLANESGIGLHIDDGYEGSVVYLTWEELRTMHLRIGSILNQHQS